MALPEKYATQNTLKKVKYLRIPFAQGGILAGYFTVEITIFPVW